MMLFSRLSKSSPRVALSLVSSPSWVVPVAGFSSLARFELPSQITNEPMKTYAPGSPERTLLRASLDRLSSRIHDVPCIVNGESIYTENISDQVCPSNHRHVLARVHQASSTLVHEAIEGALRARKTWAETPFEDRAAIFLKAADLLATKYRADLCAATMLGQGKNVWQAEIDAAAELIDFWRMNVKFAHEIYARQPTESSFGIWNRVEYRPLEGFVFAISPFNFTAIGGNLPTSAALMGNVAIWKPTHTSSLSNYIIMQILHEAGLPDGVIQFLPSSPSEIGPVCIAHPDLAGLHFTGSTRTFQTLYKQVVSNIEKYKSYPRIVGETGGKNFHFIHPSADVEHVVNSTIRGAFEYQGQKCSATSRLYCPESLWPQISKRLVEEVQKIKVGSVTDFSVFMSAVIDENAFLKISKYIEMMKSSPDTDILVGGTYDDSVGYFINPTIGVTRDPNFVTLREEIFGPVLTCYVYPDEKFEETLDLCDSTSPYALTGAIFSRERYPQMVASDKLRNAAGNFYINDKSTGSIVGQQPFGGARSSGTNDKAGSDLNLLRWVSARSIKENFVPLSDWRYPHMSSD